MTADQAIWWVLAGSISIGLLWGRVSARSRLPELFQMLGAPILVGILAVLAGCAYGAWRLKSGAPLSTRFLHLVDVASVRSMLGYSTLLFTVGAFCGIPGIAGWAMTYRRLPRNEQRDDAAA